MFIIKQTRVFILLILALSLITGCQRKPAFHYDFETEKILDTLSWKCKTIFSLSYKHATSGQKSLEMNLYPSPYPGIALSNFNSDWSRHDTLKFDIYNQEDISLRLAIRIDDAKNPSYGDRYNHPIILSPGMNHISIPLSSLHTSGTDRMINLANVQQVILFLVQPERKQTIYLDNIRLE
ncbi:MAG: hypothetical protein K8F52_04810 [Candidatus Scalindua rubra]|uniref:Lipoprotein n=1 Tax=Candidatus Scalindua brodae TaxID=237368 RepID=A0A0B0EL09_9BACT|nr:MAG: hypothetical protein SCABRO_01032 [Candidatus Scalindua brodae]MBZ0107967.1 hypothetical protein [Candidatus Scalindua rubra]TWU31084.1 hypothetical protein S225a_23070 [Candidatus Brocadiaceae bacterium S225]